MNGYKLKARTTFLLGLGIICICSLHMRVIASNLISEDKIWEYFNREGQPEGSRRFSRYKFSGTETTNNLTYHRLVRIYESRILIQGSPEKEWEEIRVDDYDEVLVALMREDEDKVYLLLSPQNFYAKYDQNSPQDPLSGESDPFSNLYVYHDPENGINGLIENDEVVLYDFSESEEEFISNTKVLISACVKNDEAFLNVIGNTIHISTGMIEINSELVKTYTVIPVYLRDMVETVSLLKYQPEDFQLTYTREFGNIGRGTLFELTNERAFRTASDIWGEEEVRLNRVLDLEGNVLYSTPHTIYPSALHEMDADCTHDLKVYDLMGREIRNPQRGKVYIRGGKKFVAR